MADGASMNLNDTPVVCLGLSEAIQLLQDGMLSTDITVQAEERILTFAKEDVQNGSALQRLMGLSRLLGVLKDSQTPNVQVLRSGKPVLHPRVAEILDALRQKD